MTKYDLIIKSKNKEQGFDGEVKFTDLTFEKSVEVAKMFDDNYSYVCEYIIKESLPV